MVRVCGADPIHPKLSRVALCTGETLLSDCTVNKWQLLRLQREGQSSGGNSSGPSPDLKGYDAVNFSLLLCEKMVSNPRLAM